MVYNLDRLPHTQRLDDAGAYQLFLLAKQISRIYDSHYASNYATG